MFTVYILRSTKNKRLYTGSTVDLSRRLYEHNSGKSKYTKSTYPFDLIYKEEYESRSEAYKRELYFKAGKGREFLKEKLEKRA